jgi:hypothetical protein
MATNHHHHADDHSQAGEIPSGWRRAVFGIGLLGVITTITMHDDDNDDGCSWLCATPT